MAMCGKTDLSEGHMKIFFSFTSQNTCSIAALSANPERTQNQSNINPCNRITEFKFWGPGMPVKLSSVSTQFTHFNEFQRHLPLEICSFLSTASVVEAVDRTAFLQFQKK